jgi:cold shock CspA family protein
MMSEKITGTVSKVLAGGSCFISPDGSAFDDRGASIYCHIKALARSGITSVMCGTRLAFKTRPSKYENAKPEALLDV